MHVYVIATLDTKGLEAAWLRDRLQELGVAARLVDAGCVGEAVVTADIGRAEVFAAAGADWRALARQQQRDQAIKAAAQGAARLVADAYARGELAGVVALGGSAGTTIGTSAMKVLPLGVPKVMLSTMAAGDVRAFVGAKDITMIYSVVDIAGLNRISQVVLYEAAAAMAGMIRFRRVDLGARERPIVAATMFGVTTPCVQRAQAILQEAGFEVLVFHATGSGGQAMEGLIHDGLIAGVLDVTTTELADELVGGVLSAGPDRLAAAARRGIPQVVSVGATDMVNFWAMATVPELFRTRRLHRHNENVTLMRTTADECRQIGDRLAAQVEASTGPALVLLPRAGVSALDRAGQPFDDPEARRALFEAIRQGCRKVPVEELDCHINDPQFAEVAATRLIQMLQQSGVAGSNRPQAAHGGQ
jgi:uncharacterized protein (UPF0261 family)